MGEKKVYESPRLTIDTRNIRGLRGQTPGVIDDSCDVEFEPTFAIGRDGRMRIKEISIVKKGD